MDKANTNIEQYSFFFSRSWLRQKIFSTHSYRQGRNRQIIILTKARNEKKLLNICLVTPKCSQAKVILFYNISILIPKSSIFFLLIWNVPELAFPHKHIQSLLELLAATVLIFTYLEYTVSDLQEQVCILFRIKQGWVFKRLIFL